MSSRQVSEFAELAEEPSDGTDFRSDSTAEKRERERNFIVENDLILRDYHSTNLELFEIAF